MRIRARTQRLLRVAAIGVAIAVAAVYLLRWPSGWSRVRIGMTQREVVALVGPPTLDERRIKGYFWIEQRHLARYELWLTLDEADRVVAFTIERRLGTTEHFYEQQLRGDLGVLSERRRR